MLTGKSGLGVIADLSYAIPDGIEFNLPYYWQFYLWGEKGTLSFSMNTETLFYEKGKTIAEKIEDISAIDYLTDFLALVNGEKDVILPMQEVFNSTRVTLKTQKFSNEI